jgi:hypothetical protein
MNTATDTMTKSIKTGGLLFVLWTFLMHPALAQEYWAAGEVPAVRQPAKAWTKKEVANLLAIAMPEDGLTDKKVAALEELADATERNSPLPDGFEKTILSILGRPEAQVTVPAARIVGNLRLESARGELESLATSASSADGVAAMKALVRLGGEKSIVFLRKLYLQKCVPRVSHFGAEVIDETDRERANIICALIELDTEITASDVMTHFSRFPSDSYNKHIWGMLFSRANGPSATIRSLEERKLPISVATLGIECARAKAKDPQLLIDAIERAASAPAKRDNAEQDGGGQPATRSESK